MELLEEKCEPITANSAPTSDEEAQGLLETLPGWQMVLEDGIKKLRYEFQFKGYLQVLVFTNRLSDASMRQGHYPLVVFKRDNATVTWWTQKIRNIHRNDFIMAAKTEDIYKGMDLTKITGY